MPKRRGRPSKPTARHTTLMLNPALKRRAAARAIAEGRSLHQIVEAALRAFLKRR